ncbi:MAG: carboxypeptidase regulatory-like domain-containing protein [Candidatus Moranbacteria bacterium]|nr:carboxypeptidase regulatory-like domain-containing protein [Candidatus Moranbacteria bacterium]
MAHFFQKNPKGFTLIESLVFLFLFAIISLTFFETYAQSTRLIIDSKNRLGATALANQKMEIIRSIDYDAIGTTTGIPAGDLVENETVLVNTVKYEVHTFVQYVDDSFDGTVGAGDVIPTDYKRVRLTVSWGDLSADRSVAIFGNFSPRGVETAGGGGVLAINILDGSGSGVANATVHIVNAGAGVNVSATTDATGNIMFPGAPVGTEDYVLTVSKNNYYGATTYPPYPTSAFNPVDVHASVVAGVLNQKTIVIDQLSDIALTTQDPFGTTVPNVGYTLSGGRVLGTDPVSGNVVNEFSDTAVTDVSGIANYTDQSYGQYLMTISGTDYQFLKFSPESTLVNELTATAGAVSNVTAVLMDKRIGSVLVKVQSQVDGSPLPGASVKLSNVTLPYDVTIVTDQYGFAYFPSVLPALLPGTYDIEVVLAGYTTINDSVVVNGALEVEVINMSP